MRHSMHEFGQTKNQRELERAENLSTCRVLSVSIRLFFALSACPAGSKSRFSQPWTRCNSPHAQGMRVGLRRLLRKLWLHEEHRTWAQSSLGGKPSHGVNFQISNSHLPQGASPGEHHSLKRRKTDVCAMVTNAGRGRREAEMP